MKGGNKKREVKMVVDREEVYTIKQLIASMWEKWCNPEKEISHLKPSYASIRDEDIKWKMIDFVNCSGRINFFFSGGIGENVPMTEDDQNESEKETMWI